MAKGEGAADNAVADAGGAAPAAGAQGAAEAPSPLAAADAAKRDGAPKAEGDAAPAADAPKPDAKADAKPDAAPAKDAPADGAKDSPKPEDAKPAEAKPDAKDAAKPEGEVKSETEADKPKEALADAPPAPPPVYDALKLPEGVKFDAKLVAEIDARFGKLETEGKVDHALVQSLRQDLMTQHLAEVQRIHREVEQNQRDVWSRYKESEISALKADPQLGGNRIETTLGNAKYAYESMLGLETAEQKTLMERLDAAGISSNRLFIKALHNLYERFREPEPVPPNPPGVINKSREAGQRGWYSSVDGVTLA